MSADYYIHCSGCGERINLNVTFNLSEMLAAAGFPAHDGRADWEALVGLTGRDAEATLSLVSANLRETPDKYKLMNPPNGWGSYTGALAFIEEFASLCRLNPDSVIEGWL